jgi:NADH dehydrogenase (ubiquinone) 1 alpha/beta subcomplex 1
LDPKVVTERVIEVIKNFEKVSENSRCLALTASVKYLIHLWQVEHDKITPSAKFKDDLGLDSLDAVEVVMALEEEFCIEIPDSEADKILSIPDAVAYISGQPMAK